MLQILIILSSPVSSSRSDTGTSSTIARSGSPPRSTFEATKKNKAGHKNVSNEGKKDNDGRHVAVMALDLPCIGSQFD